MTLTVSSEFAFFWFSPASLPVNVGSFMLDDHVTPVCLSSTSKPHKSTERDSAKRSFSATGMRVSSAAATLNTASSIISRHTSIRFFIFCLLIQSIL